MTLLTLRPINSQVHSVHRSDGTHVGNLKRIEVLERQVLSLQALVPSHLRVDFL